MFLASEAEELSAVISVDTELLNAVKSVDIEELIASLAVEAELLSAVCEVLNDALTASKSPPNVFLASEADPDKVATELLIIWSVVVRDAEIPVNAVAADAEYVLIDIVTSVAPLKTKSSMVASFVRDPSVEAAGADVRAYEAVIACDAVSAKEDDISFVISTDDENA